MKYAVFCLEDTVYVVDAPKDDRHAIADALMELGADIIYGEEAFLECVEAVSRYYRVDASTARQMIYDHNNMPYKGGYVNWNCIYYVPYPPNTKVGRYPYEYTWEPKFRRPNQ